MKSRDAKFKELIKSRKNEIRELRNALAREPLLDNVVKEMKRTKPAFAMVHLEKEQAVLKFMNYSRESSTENAKRTFA